MLYIVIPVFNRWEYTRACLESLSKQTYMAFKIVVVDHGSTDNTSSNISAYFPEVQVLQGDDKMWWTAATNLGIEYALTNGASCILTLNNDLTVESNYLGNIVRCSIDNPLSIVGSMSVDISNRDKVFFAGFKWDSLSAKYAPSVSLDNSYDTIAHAYNIIETDILPGRGTLFPSKIFRQIGSFDAINFPHYMADEDLILRSKKIGYKALVSTNCVTYSHVFATGLNTQHVRKDLNYWKNFFTSIRSPNNITYRWRWAKRHGKIPILYFLMDYGRIIGSQIIKSLK